MRGENTSSNLPKILKNIFAKVTRATGCSERRSAFQLLVSSLSPQPHVEVIAMTQRLGNPPHAFAWEFPKWVSNTLRMLTKSGFGERPYYHLLTRTSRTYQQQELSLGGSSFCSLAWTQFLHAIEEKQCKRTPVSLWSKHNKNGTCKEYN